MSQEFVIEAFPRDDQGRGASRRLRREERKIPAIIYGGNKDATPIAIWHNELKKALENEAFFSHVLTVELNGKKESVILKDLQRHPYKPILTHADFLRVDKDHEIHVNVPLHFINEEKCHGVKMQGGIVAHAMTELEVTCLPKDLPEFIEVDMLNIEVGQTVHISDLSLPEGVESVALSHGEDHDLPVANVITPRGGVQDDADGEGDDDAEATEEKSED